MGGVSRTKISWAERVWNPQWKDIPGFDGYEVSNYGQIQKIGGQPRKTHKEKSGHLSVMIRRKRLRVHHAVLFAFVGPMPDGMECRHLDGNPENNTLENLCWGTRQQNMDDKSKHGTQPWGESSVTAKLTSIQVLEIRQRWEKESSRKLASEYGVSHTAIRRAALGIKWKRLEALL